jgi:hypothetical protein
VQPAIPDKETENLNSTDVNRALDNAFGKGETWLVMRHPRRAANKKLEYPQETPGSRLAAKARKLASKLTPEQRRGHFNAAMTMIYATV